MWLIQQSAPTMIHSTTWSAQGWRLVTHPRFLTMPHHDCCGMNVHICHWQLGSKDVGSHAPKMQTVPRFIGEPAWSVHQCSWLLQRRRDILQCRHSYGLSGRRQCNVSANLFLACLPMLSAHGTCHQTGFNHWEYCTWWILQFHPS